MLILTRRPGQILHLGEDIILTLAGIRGNQVRLGIEAPPSIPVYRHEIWQLIQQEKQERLGCTQNRL